MKQTKQKKEQVSHACAGGASIMKIFSFVFAVCAFVLGMGNVMVMASMSDDKYTEVCQNESYTGGEEELCLNMTMQYSDILFETKMAETLVLFSTCIVLTLFGLMKRN